MFDAECKLLASDPAPGLACRRLATHALDGNQLTRLGRAMAKARAGGRSLAPLLPFRLGVLGNATLDLVAPMLVASGARHGLAIECIVADYGQTTQEALDPGSRINMAKPDAVLLAIDHRGLPFRFMPGDTAAECADVAAAQAQLGAIRTGIRSHTDAVCIVQTLAAPPETMFGSFDRLVAGTARRTIEQLNLAICASMDGSEDLLLDIGALAETVGLGTWHSPSQWNLAKLPCDAACLPLYAEHTTRLIASMLGRSRKCLVLDLDNTVWGGVIGDDGLEGIKLAQGDATGEAHLAVQTLALALRQRGIVLAVSSKNTDEVARSPFRAHPDMLLKEAHIAVFQANWNDKATNIKAIAEELSLGLEAMVFLDDNPAERDLVRRLLPNVAVPELPDDPAWYARTLAAAGYFEATGFSDEDRGRAGMYQSSARRVALREQAGDLDAYLASLDMEIVFAPFDRTGRVRISQLINKSNQFNLTTRRYREADLAAVEADPGLFTLQVRLLDSFGDNGMISVVICRPGDEASWVIDTWLMSCRVLGRKVEQMVLREVLRQACERGVRSLVGIYRPTEKNGLVRDHYQKLGFTPAPGHSDGSTWWTLPTSTAVPAVPMRVRQLDHALQPA